MKKKLEINLGNSFWIGISFAGGVFGFGWQPFWWVLLIVGLLNLIGTLGKGSD